MSIRDEVMQHYDGLFEFATRLTKNTEEAKDLLHDTVIRAFEHEASYQDDRKLFSWMSKIMFNLFLTKYRVRSRRESQYDPELAIARLSVDPNQTDVVELSLLADKIRQLPIEHQQALVATALGKTSVEIAAELGVPEVTIRTRIYRARQALSAKVLKNKGNKR